MLPGWTLAAMREADVDEVLLAERESFVDPWSRHAFLEEVLREAEGGYSRVLRIDGELAAYMIAWYMFDEAHLANIAVRESFRGRGCARALLDDFLREGEARGALLAFLEVRAGNADAIRLYRGYGFRQVAVRKNYYQAQREDALVMVRELRDEEE